MQGTVTARSPAKLNLHLEVQSKRDDGYHSIISIFQMIGLYDEMQCCSLKDENVCRIIGMPDIPDEENSVYRAFTQFKRFTGVKSGVEFTIRKRIPRQSGMGGGSGNAGYALRMLNHLFQTGLGFGELAELGAAVGSDVPFFLRGPSALITGRGEIVSTLEPRSGLQAVVVVPDFSVSTADAYAEFDKKTLHIRSIAPEELVRRYRECEPSLWEYFNSFEPVLETGFPEISAIKSMLRELGAEYTAMSGSGSSCFGIFRKKEDAKHAFTSCVGRYGNCWLVNLLAKSPDTVLQ